MPASKYGLDTEDRWLATRCITWEAVMGLA